MSIRESGLVELSWKINLFVRIGFVFMFCMCDDVCR